MKRASVKRGRIHAPDTMFLRMHVGEAKSGDMGYELDTNMAAANPIVRSKQSGKWFTLSWQDIIELAIEAGIDAPDRAEPRKRGGR